ncbi:polysaccharide biosynthesis tyrosine autokinase [Chroococcus sp. FPU101]|uniref:polysaccharide biosynthesis tyrosine autokinase n=1 Tax=Chroococcus sp. FPU101 TaxID=1974212 RepID=UPI001A8C3EF4|nr:tyrosine-protein kinase domain-containing protein [Chroococcus sp. FPU101]GFE70862.1 putative lipopolysaccharide biosynthesis [Chroococcus sp. FPU101]
MTEYAQESLIEEQETAGSSSNKELNLRPLIRTFRRKAWLIGGLTTLTTISALIYLSFKPSTYIGNFYLLVEPITSAAKLTDPTTLTRTGGVPKDDLFALDYPTNLAFLKSPGMTYRIAKDVHEQESDRTVPAIWKDLRDHLTVERIGTTQATATKIFAVSYEGEDAEEVQAILNTAAQTFLKYSAEDRETSLKAGVSFIDKQLPDLMQRLNKLQSEQQKIRQQYDLLDPVQKGQANLEQIQNLDTQLISINDQLSTQKTLYKNLEKLLKLTPDEALVAASLSQDPIRVSLSADLQKIDAQIAIESARFTSQSPILQTLKEQRANINNLLEEKNQQLLAQSSKSLSRPITSLDWQNPTRLKFIEQYITAANEIQTLEARRQELVTIKKNLEQQTRNYPEIIRNYQDIDRKIILTTQLLDRLQTQRETLRVEAAQELPWQLISKPQIPLDKDGKPISYPPSRTKIIVAGLGGGLLLGGLLAILLEKRRDKFYTSEDIQDLASTSLVGTIPWNESSQIVPSPLLPTVNYSDAPILEPQTVSTLTEVLQSNEASTVRVNTAVQTQEPSSAFLVQPSSVGFVPSPNQTQQSFFAPSGWNQEKSYYFLSAFDTLYAQLSLINNNQSLKSIVVSSVEVDDGQTTVAVYLANAAAATGSRVLIVDANWHNPQLHHYFNLLNYKGLDHLLNDGLHPSDVVQAIQDTPNLFVLTSGLSEIGLRKRLWSPKMKELMERLNQEYDLVIYDLPHFFDSTDISFMTTQTNGLLLVVDVFKTSQSLVKKAISEINRLKLPFLGTVANHSKEPSNTLL